MLENYEVIDEFVDAMNESAGNVGDSSIYKFNKFRSAVGLVFVLITTVAIGFIAAEFIRGFDLDPIMGIEPYWLAMYIGTALGGYIAWQAEDAKITTIKGTVFSEGANRMYQFFAAGAIITVLIIINANGVQKIADFSLRYMDQELKDSYLLKLKEQKMQAHIQATKAQANATTIDKSAIKTLMLSRQDLVNAKNREIAAINDRLNTYIAGFKNPAMWRTSISRAKVKASKDIAKIEDRYSKKIAALDWKIRKQQKMINKKVSNLAKTKAKQMEEADKSAKELEDYYKNQTAQNQEIVAQYKDIGLLVAVSGEVIDGILAFLLFILVKSNPNTNGIPKVDINTRELPPRIVAPPRKVKAISAAPTSGSSVRRTRPKKQEALSIFNTDAGRSRRGRRELLAEIKRVALDISLTNDKYINGYLKHATQREIIQEFRNQGKSVTPLEIQEYFDWNADNLIFINQKKGFAYKEYLAEEVA